MSLSESVIDLLYSESCIMNAFLHIFCIIHFTIAIGYSSKI